MKWIIIFLSLQAPATQPQETNVRANFDIVFDTATDCYAIANGLKPGSNEVVGCWAIEPVASTDAWNSTSLHHIQK
jgi:hypothetical protein